MSHAQDWLAELEAKGDVQKAHDMARYHKTDRQVFGVSNGYLDDIAKTARKATTLDERLSAAQTLWKHGAFEARILSAKLLTQARMRPDDQPAWTLIQNFVAEFDGWAIADAMSIAGSKRLMAKPARLDEVELWLDRDHLWSRRAALVMTLPFARLRHPKDAETAAIDRVLGWAARLTQSKEWFEQKAVAWWLRDLSRKHPARTMAFLEQHQHNMARFAVKEASRLLTISTSTS